MVSNTKRHNFKGSASANFKQGFNFNELLLKNGYDINRFEPIGIEYNKDDSDYVISIICFDKDYSTSEKEHTTKCQISDKLSIIDLFLNINITLINRRINILENEITAKVLTLTDDSDKNKNLNNDVNLAIDEEL